MSPIILDNPQAPRVKRAAALARKKERRERQRFLVEGPQAVRELLVHQPSLTEVVFTTTGAEHWQHEIDRLASAAEVRVERATDAVLAAVTDTVTPQGVVAVARMPEVDLAAALQGAQLVAILHAIRDPGNAGTVLRAADAAGADAVVFSGECIDPFHPKVVRSTTGSLFHVPVTQTRDLGEALAACRAAGLTSFAADVHGEDLITGRAELAQPVAWVFGNEARGLTDSERAMTDRALKLPIYGKAESLNLATAASVLLYETAFAQRAATGE